MASNLAPDPIRPALRTRWLAALAICALAVNLRAPLASLSPVLPEIMADTGLMAANASLFMAVSVLMLGIWSPLVPFLARWMTWERIALAGLCLIFVGGLARITGSVPGVMLGSALAGIGIAFGNVLIPTFVKRDFPDRMPLMMGLCTMFICVSAAAPTAMTLPLAGHLGGWPQALAIWAAPAFLALVLWIPRRGPPLVDHALRPRPSRVWTRPLAWQVAAFMGLQSVLAYSVLAWFVALIRDRGVDAELAGMILGGSFFVQLLAAMFTPSLATRGRDQRPAVAIIGLLTVCGLVGVIFAPVGMIWLWCILLGLGQGALFALALTLMTLRSATPQVAAQLSSMSQTTGYVLAAFGPLVVGLIREHDGASWDGVAIFLVAVTLACTIAGLYAGRDRQLQ